MDRGVYVLTENKNKQRNRKVENEAETTLVLYSTSKKLLRESYTNLNSKSNK